VKRFLTQCLVDHETAAKSMIRHQGDWHRCVWQAFNPIEGDRGPRRFLYAVEETSQGYKSLILSDEIPTRPDWCPVQGWTTKVVPSEFLNHSRYAFGLTANPTRVHSVGDTKTRISLAQRLSPEDDPQPRLLDWLERKGAVGGFRIYRRNTLAISSDVQTFRTSDQSQQITLHYVRYQGVLEVTDQSLFETTFHSGIGHAKAFGAGLLLLKPIS
jgi:CRISPR system Cascade subunit CasE